MYMQSRTDLALEEHEYMVSQHAAEKKQTHIHGVEILDEQFPSDQISISTVNITTKNAAKALNKPMGTYITMEAPLLDIPDDGYHREISGSAVSDSGGYHSGYRTWQPGCHCRFSWAALY